MSEVLIFFAYLTALIIYVMARLCFLEIEAERPPMIFPLLLTQK